MFIYWDCKILSGTATFHKRGVLDCNFQNPSEIPAVNSPNQLISVHKLINPDTRHLLINGQILQRIEIKSRVVEKNNNQI